MPAGTLLLAACSIDAGHGRQSAIRMYRSYDIGKSWEQFGTVAVGGGLETGVWEPFLMVLPDGRLACYYSDATDEPNHSQKLVMKISEDGVNWGDVIDIVALSDQRKRPGMATIVQLNDGRFMMTYEMCDAEDPGCGNPITYRFSDDGISWGDPKDPGIKVVTDTGAVPGSAPYLAYLPNVGDNGLLLMTAVFQTPSQKRAISSTTTITWARRIRGKHGICPKTTAILTVAIAALFSRPWTARRPILSTISLMRILKKVTTR